MPARKYTYLKKAREAGVTVPAVIYIPANDFASTAWKKRIQEFHKEIQSTQYIVRSAVAAEDHAEQSFAGHFVSSKAVTSHDLSDTALQIFKENKKIAKQLPDTPSVSVIVMPFINSELGGVLFSPWLYFHQHALIEFASSPQDAVAGHNVQQGLLSLSKEYPDVKAAQKLPASLKNSLQKSVCALHSCFDFPLDIEWVYDGTTCYILQVRPVTIAPSAIHTKSLPQKSPYTFTELSETFGKLSPLSYALIAYLYQNATQYQNLLQIRGHGNFLTRMPTGNILVDTKKYQSYHHPRRPWSAFTRSFTAQRNYDALMVARENFHITQSFSLKDTQDAFNAWQAALALETILKKPSVPYAEPFEYELGTTITLSNYPKNSLSQGWKYTFLESLAPLRTLVSNNKQLLWHTDLETLHTQTAAPKALQRYHDELYDSLYTYTPHTNTNRSKKLYGNSVTAAVHYIKNPAQETATLPRDKIIVTPYIPQAWIHELPHLTGIITSSLSALSHVAITLREHKIPTALVTETDLQALREASSTSIT